MGTGKKGAAASGKLWFGLACFLVAASGCRKSDSDMPGSGVASVPAPVVSGDTGVVTSDAFKVSVVTPSTGISYKYFLHSQQASFSSGSCSVAPGTASPSNDIYCFVDVSELDLYFNGVSLEFNAPPGMCAYTGVELYHYWGLQPGSVPGSTACTVVTNKATGSVTSHTCSAGSNLTWNGADFRCDFDYSGSSGPNCCEGQYTLTKGVDDSGTTTFDPPTTVSMTGKMSNCLMGPGMDVAGFQDEAGYSRPVYFDSAQGRNRKFDFKSPISFPRVSNLYLGNYWDAKDFERHGIGTEPVTIFGIGQFPPLYSDDMPKAFSKINNYEPQHYYEFRCMDVAEDTIARIRVLVRSWDTVASFTANSNPYTDPTTKEPGYNGDYYKNDRGAWTDFSPTHTHARKGDIFPQNWKY